LQIDNPESPGTLVMRMPSSYVYLAGTMDVTPVIPGNGYIDVFFSDNHGLDWTQVATLSDSSAKTIDLSNLVFRRYDYRLKLVLHGGGTGLARLHVSSEIQHSQRALPALGAGDNTITFTSGDPEGTITLEGSFDPNDRDKTLLYTDFHPTLDSIGGAPLQLSASAGSITFPVHTPGDLVRLRFGTFHRLRDAGDTWQYRVSFDGGATWTTARSLQGPVLGDGAYVVFEAVPPGIRDALVQFSGTQSNTAEIFDWRIDADYREPAGGFAPVKVTYQWEEAGAPKSDVHIARSPNEQWTLHCATKPLMKAITVELAE